MRDDHLSPMAVIARHQASPPVRLADIVKDLGIRVRRLPLGKTIAGQIMRTPGQTPSGYTILINSDDPLVRQKFTLAHEIAHFVLHRDLIEDGIIDDTMYRSELGNYYETQANQLAADILLPVRLVKAQWKSGVTDIKALARLFEVSEQAMKIRLKGMNLLEAA